MPPVLIYKDEERIEEEKLNLNIAVDNLQSIYDGFKAIGLTVTIDDIILVLQQASKLSLPSNDSIITQRFTSPTIRGIEHLEAFVKNKLLDLAGQPQFNGISFSRSLLEQHVVVPDLAALANILIECRLNYSGNTSIRTNLLALANDVISKVANSDTQIEQEYTYLTKTDKGATLATHLKTICDSLNNFAAVFPPGQYGNGWGVNFNNEHWIPGITVRNASFIPDLKFIRERE
ncbi:MAG: hypothetical protein ACO1OF_13965 [Adhaeribacter sp.]